LFIKTSSWNATNFSFALFWSVYQKADGKYYYGLIIKDSMTWFQADEACKLKGGMLPEITNFAEHFNILKLKVNILYLVN